MNPVAIPSRYHCELHSRQLLVLCGHLADAGFEGRYPLIEASNRISRVAWENRTIEPGAAYRVIRVAAEYRKTADHNPEIVEALYKVARWSICHEDGPSPGWVTMLAEEGFPPDPTGTVNDY